jgi:hypothetical protein
MKCLIASLLVLLFARSPHAGTIVRFRTDAQRNAATISAGYDASIVTLTFGYARAFDLTKIRRTLVLNTGFGFPLMSFDFKDFRLNISPRLSLVNLGRFQLPVSFGFLARNTRNEAYNAFGFGTALGIFPGYYTEKLTLAAEAVWDAQLATYITFSDYYKESVYEEGTEGWYGATSHLLRFGARIGGLIKRRLEIYARGGFELQGKYNVKIPPAYGVLGLSTRF